MNPVVLEELARLGAKPSSKRIDLDVPAPLRELLQAEWPKGVTYRTMADQKTDREVWWASFGIAREVGTLVAFGTSDNGNVAVCVRRDDPSLDDPTVTLVDAHGARSLAPLSVFLASLEREPTRGRRL